MFLSLKNAKIGYKFPLIESISAELDLGEMCLIIGNNGAGKTTLIKSILNQIPTVSGEILLEDKNINNLSAKEIAEKIAVVFSKSQIPQNYTTTDLISLGKYIHYPYYFELNKTDKEEVTTIIQDLNLEEYRDLPLTKLSDGNLQKAFIGRALAQNSPMIILDEPTTHLDEQNKIAVLKILRNFVKKRNKLILFSSHDWRLAKEFSDKIWFVKDKNILSGNAEDIFFQQNELRENVAFFSNENLKLPQISAPEFHKNLLISALRKNFDSDMSGCKIDYKDGFWMIKIGNFTTNAVNFENVIKILRNHYQ